jgi:hypothetical protein
MCCSYCTPEETVTKNKKKTKYVNCSNLSYDATVFLQVVTNIADKCITSILNPENGGDTFSKVLVTTYSILHHNPEGHNQHLHHHKNLNR